MSVFDQFNTSESPILFPVTERRVAWITKLGEPISTPTHKALVRAMPDGSPRLLNVVGSSYKMIHNRELFNAIEETIEREMPSHMLEGVQVRDKVANFGRVCFREYTFPATAVKLDTHSQVAFRMIAQNGYGGSALRVHAGAIDFFCTNGIIRGDYTSVYNKHTSGLTIANFSDTIQRAIDQFNEARPIWLKWTQKPVKYQEAMALFRSLAASEKLVDRLGDQYLHEREAHGETLWAVYSAMTHYASHNSGEFALRKTAEEQDSVANIMLSRELTVADWVSGDKWKALEEA